MSNLPIEVAVEELSPIRRRMQVTIPAARVDASIEEALRKIQRTARIKGFRPGHAPRALVQRMFAREWRSEVMDKLLQEGLSAALDQTGLQPIGMPDIADLGDLEPGNPLAFSAAVEVLPEIALGDLGAIEAEVPAIVVDDQDVALDLDATREQKGHVDPVETGAESGHLVTVKHTITAAGEAERAVEDATLTVELGKEEIGPGVDALLLGAKPGDAHTVEAHLPSPYRVASLADKDVTIELTVERVEKRFVPDLDDEFAKDLGFDTLDALRADVRARLEKQAAERFTQSKHNAAMTALIEREDFEVPEALVDAHLDQQVQTMFYGIQPEFAARLKERLRERPEVVESARRAVRGSLLIRALARAESIEPTAEAVEEFIEELVAGRRDAAKARAMYAKQEARDRVRSHLTERLCLEFLVAKAQIRVVGERPLREAERA